MGARAGPPSTRTRAHLEGDAILLELELGAGLPAGLDGEPERLAVVAHRAVRTRVQLLERALHVLQRHRRPAAAAAAATAHAPTHAATKHLVEHLVEVDGAAAAHAAHAAGEAAHAHAAKLALPHLRKHLRKQVVWVDAARHAAAAKAARTRAAATALEAGLAVTVVNLLLVRIGQRLVRLGHLLEPLLRLRTLALRLGAVLVRMPLDGHFPIPFLDVVGRRVASDAQRLVVVDHRADERSSSGTPPHASTQERRKALKAESWPAGARGL